ncbi:MAG: glycosyltransferase family 9 protein [Verrucomicrobiia bacterium]
MSQGVTVVETHRMGDAVMALPFVIGAREAGWRVTVAAPPGTIEVFRLVLAEADCLELPRRGCARALAQARERWGSEIAVCGWADPRVHAWMVQAGFRRRIGFPPEPVNLFAREAALLAPHHEVVRFVDWGLSCWLGPLLTDRLMRKAHGQHHAEDWRQVAGCLGVEARLPEDWAGRCEQSREWLVHPGAGASWKLWSESAWLTLLERMERAGIPTRVVAGPGVPRLSWRGASVDCQTVGDLVKAVRQAHGMVGLDSFPAHLASSMGRRVVVVFGEMRRCWFAPEGQRVRVVGREGRWPIRREDLAERGGTLLGQVTPDQVLAEVLALG